MAKSRRSIRSVTDLIKNFSPDPNESNSMRLARFLNEAAELLPEAFIDRRICAKIAYMQSRTPSEESDWVKKKLPGASSRAKEILKKKYGKGWDFDRVEGIRATVGSADTSRTELRRARTRVVGAIKGLRKVDDIVDVKEINDVSLKREVAKNRRVQKALDEYEAKVLLLPVAQKGKKKTS